MPRRRVIYLQRPRSGSHFRTIYGDGGGSSGGGGSSSRPPSQPAPWDGWLPPTDDPIPDGYGYNGTGTNDPSWNTGGSQQLGTGLPYGYGMPGTGNGFGLYDDTMILPPTVDSSLRPLENWEIVAGLGFMAVVAFGYAPAAFLAAFDAHTIGWGGAFVLQVGSQGMWGYLAGHAAAGTPMHVNDAPQVKWDRETNSYVLQHPSLLGRRKRP